MQAIEKRVPTATPWGIDRKNFTFLNFVPKHKQLPS